MPVQREFQILVVGAGLGGLAVARFLGRLGLDPVVVEREETVSDPAVPIELPPDALEMLGWLEVDGDVRRDGAEVHTWTRRGADRTVKHRFAADGAPGFVVAEYGRLRARLRESLPGAAVRADTTVAAVTDGDRSVTVRFDNGVVERFDAVLGADGARSTVRDAVDGPSPEAAGTVTAVIRIDAVVDTGAVERWTPSGTVLRALPGDEGTWILGTLPIESAADDAVPQERFADRLAATEWLPIDGSGTDTIRWRNDVRVAGTPIAGRRVALLGDAAGCHHPLVGVGPTLALADASVLAATLTATGPSLPERLQAYARRRQARRRRLAAPSERTPVPVPGAAGAPTTVRDALRRRATRLAAAFSDAPPTPAVDQPPGR